MVVYFRIALYFHVCELRNIFFIFHFGFHMSLLLECQKHHMTHCISLSIHLYAKRLVLVYWNHLFIHFNIFKLNIWNPWTVMNSQSVFIDNRGVPLTWFLPSLLSIKNRLVKWDASSRSSSTLYWFRPGDYGPNDHHDRHAHQRRPCLVLALQFIFFWKCFLREIVWLDWILVPFVQHRISY